MLRALLFCLLLFPAAAARAELFKDSDHWLVVGDSITQNGTYYEWVYLYYLTRFPDRKITVDNGGISGDTAAGTLRRYPWDLQPRQPTVATIMLGMNDVSRDLYNDPAPTPDMVAKREAALTAYDKNLADLAHKLQADGARLVFLTPSPFDETADLDRPRQTGVNEALGQCAIYIKELATQTGSPLIDFHEPLTALNLRLQAVDPKATFGGPDRIHPAAPGHFAMAYLLLKGQGAPALVSKVEIDAASAHLTGAENATVSNLTGDGNGVGFTSLEKALPYPVPPEAKAALDWVPFQDDLNQETLRVTGLKDGSYTLLIDDQPVGDFRSDELAAGVNLAKLETTPQAKQSAALLDLIKKWQSLVANGDRGIAQVEHFFLKDLPHPVDFETAQPKIEALLPGLDPKKDGYTLSILNRYLKMKPLEAQTRAQLHDFTATLYAAAQPAPHLYKLIPASGVPAKP